MITIISADWLQLEWLLTGYVKEPADSLVACLSAKLPPCQDYRIFLQLRLITTNLVAGTISGGWRGSDAPGSIVITKVLDMLEPGWLFDPG